MYRINLLERRIKIVIGNQINYQNVVQWGYVNKKLFSITKRNYLFRLLNDYLHHLQLMSYHYFHVDIHNLLGVNSYVVKAFLYIQSYIQSLYNKTNIRLKMSQAVEKQSKFKQTICLTMKLEKT